ncbi:MAG: nicotinamide-nucleotide amidohydrolase family protein [Leptospiraceae bacterium]|nr:nicotinamide-nucleotide amidohydrolase family protein [Leptospiraceae bacterium]
MQYSIHILSTGTELVSGRSRDGNGPFLCAYFSDAGYSVSSMTILPDDPEQLFQYFQKLESEASKQETVVVVMTGGLGPTEDDHTVDVLSRFSGASTKEDPEALRRLQWVARKSSRVKLESARRQVRVLDGQEVVSNRRGLAPGILMKKNTAAGGEMTVLALPGVPSEMHPMFDSASHALKQILPSTSIHRSVLYIYGEGESSFQARVIEPIRDDLSPDFRWGITSGRGHIRIFLESPQRREIALIENSVAESYPRKHFRQPVEDLIHEHFLEKKYLLATAESCTGGLVGKLITDRPGSSGYYYGGAVVYSNEAKVKVLGVSREILDKSGAVSEPCARAMASELRLRTGVNYALSITGIAGPEGGSDEKPVGTVFVGLAGPDGSEVMPLFFPLDRERVREYTAIMSMYLLYDFVLRTEGS